MEICNTKIFKKMQPWLFMEMERFGKYLKVDLNLFVILISPKPETSADILPTELIP